MDEWDEEKLDEVIKKKHGSEKSNATDIVSFIFKYTSRVILPLKERPFQTYIVRNTQFIFRYVNISLKQSKIVSTVGFGTVQLKVEDKNANIDTLCRLAMC